MKTSLLKSTQRAGNYLRLIMVLLICFAGGITSIQAQSCQLQLTATNIKGACSNSPSGSVELVPSGGAQPYTYGNYYTFSGSALNTQQFDFQNGNFSQNGQLVASGGVYYTDWNNSVSTKSYVYDNGAISLEGTFNFQNNSNVIFGFISGNGSPNFSSYVMGIYYSNGYLYAVQNGGSYWTGYNYFSPGTDMDFKIERSGSYAYYYYRITGSSTWNTLYTTTINSSQQLRVAANYYQYYGEGGFSTKNWRLNGGTYTTNLVPGTYDYSVSDANGCTASVSVTIPQLTSSVVVTASDIQAACENSAGGSVQLTASGGLAPFSFGQTFGFSGLTINNWFQTRNGNFSTNNGELTASGTNNYGNNIDNSVVGNKVIDDDGLISVEASFKFSSGYYGTQVIFGFVDATGTIYNENNHAASFYFQNGNMYVRNGYNQYYVNASYSYDTYYDFRIVKQGSALRYYSRPTGTSSWTQVYTTTYNGSATQFRFGANYYQYYNNYGGFTTKSWKYDGEDQTTQLYPGTYNYTMSDASGCTADVAVTIPVAPSTVVIGVSDIQGTCAEGASGSVVLTPSGGVAPYTFGKNISFGNGAVNTTEFTVRNGNFSVSNNELVAATSGNYTGYDNSIVNNQLITDNGNVTVEGSFKYDAGGYYGNLSLFGLVNATDQITDPSNFQAAFFYQNGNMYIRQQYNQYYVGNYSAGVYYDLKIEKLGGTVKYYTRQSGGSWSLVYTSSISASGQFRLAASYYSYYSSYYTGFSSKNWKTSVNAPTTNLSAGTYTYDVTDANGCKGSVSVTIPVLQSTVVITASNIQGACAESGSGSVVLTPSGGVAPYSYGKTYSFAGTGSVNLNDFDVRNGNFSLNNELVATSNSGYYGYDNSITTKSLISDNGNISVEGTVRFDPNGYYGTLVLFGLVNATGAVTDPSNYQAAFFYQNGNMYIRQQYNDYYVGNYTSGVYYDLKIEKQGSVVKYYTRQNGASWNLVYTGNVSGTTSQMRLSASYYSYYGSYYYGGFASKNWKIGATPQTTGLLPGTYSYQVTDANGCKGDITVTIPELQSSVVFTASNIQGTCESGASGSVQLTASGGVEPYVFGNTQNYVFGAGTIDNSKYDIRNGNFQLNGSELIGNTYYGYSGWDNSVVSKIILNDNSNLSVEGSVLFDNSGNNGTQVAFGLAKGGNPVTDLNSYAAAFYFSNGNMYAYIGNNNYYIGNYNYNVYYDLKIERSGSTVKFYSRNTGDATWNLVYTGTWNSTSSTYQVGISTYQYYYYYYYYYWYSYYYYYGGFKTKNWKTESVQPTTNLKAGDYVYQVKDANGCKAQITVTIPELPSSVVIAATDIQSACNGQSNGSVVLTPSGGVAPYSFGSEYNFAGTGTVDLTKFDVRNGSFSLNNELSASPAYYSSWDNSITTKEVTEAGSNVVYEASFNFGYGYYGTLMSFGLTGSNSGAITDPSQVQAGFDFQYGNMYVREGYSNTYIGNYSTGVYYDFKVEKSGTSVKYYTRTSGSTNWNLVYTNYYFYGSSQFRATALYYGYYGNYGGFTSKNWKLGAQPSTTGLSAGTYTFKVKDANGCKGSVTVVIPGSSSPTFDNYSSSVQASVVEGCSATVSYPVSVSGGGNVNYTFSGATQGSGSGTGSGSIFNVGVTHVTLTAAGNCGNSTSEFDVRVTDDIAPTIVACPSSIVTEVASGSCNAIVDVTAPAGADNCSATVSGTRSDNLSLNDPFPIGTTTITWIATDPSGNISAPCVQTVTINAPEIDITGHNLSIAAGSNSASTSNGTDFGGSLPGVAVTRTFTVNNNGTAALRINSIAVGGADPASFTVSGITFPAVVSAGASATFDVTFSANTLGARSALITIDNNDCDESSYQFAVAGEITCAPAVISVCASDQTVNNDHGTCGATVNYIVQAAGEPAPQISYVFSGATRASGNGTGSGSVFNTGVTTVTVTAMNACGTATCSFTITVKDAESPVLTGVPANTTVECTAVPEPASVTATDNCPGVGAVHYTEIKTNGNCPGNYTLIRTWSVTDAHGNSSSASQVITVVDTKAPVLTVPSNIVVSNDAGQCGAVVNFTATASDDCSGAVITYSKQPGTSFNKGITTVVVTATDACGNSSTGSFTVTVKDTEKPKITCLANQVKAVNNNDCSYKVTGSELDPSFSDNCPGATIRNSYNNSNTLAGAVFAKGSTTSITWTVTDAAGNSASCSFNVSVSTSLAASISSTNVLPQGTQPNTIYIGYAPAQTLTLNANATGGGGTYFYNWSVSNNLQISGSNTASSVKVTTSSPAAGPYTVSLVVTDQFGCKVTATTWRVNVIDVRCGNNNDKVLVCQKTSSATNPWVQICVAPSAVPAHLANGSTLGTCATSIARGGNSSSPAIAEAAIKAYPNPNTGVFELQLQHYQAGKVQIQVSDNYGKLVSQKSVAVGVITENYTIDLSSHASGVYHVTVISAEGVKTLKVAVVR